MISSCRGGRSQWLASRKLSVVSCRLSDQWSVVGGQFGARRRNEVGCGGRHCFDARRAGDGALTPFGLGFAEAHYGSVELAFDGSHVAQQRFEAFRLSGVDEEFEGAGLENLGFVTAGSLETPEASGDFADKLGFEWAS